MKSYNSFINEEYNFKKRSDLFGLKVGDYVRFGESKDPKDRARADGGGWQGHEKKKILMGKIGKIVCIKDGFALLPTCDEIGVEFFEKIGDVRYYNCEGRGRNGHSVMLNGRWLTKIDLDEMDEETRNIIVKHEKQKEKEKLKRIEFDPWGEENWD